MDQLIPVVIRLEWSLRGYPNVFGLLFAEHVKLYPDFGQVQGRNFLIQMLWQHVHLVLILISVVPQFKLSQCLVAE